MKTRQRSLRQRQHSGTIHATLVTTLFVAAELLMAHPAQAGGKSTRISNVPYAIETPGNYVLTQDLPCSGTAIKILASNVDLNLGGHTLTGDGTGDGIYVLGQEHVRIHQGAVQRFEIGVLFGDALACTIDRVTASQNALWGIAARDGTTRLTLSGNTASQNGGAGIMFDSRSRGNTITRNTAAQNGVDGIFVGDGSFANSLTGNTAEDNGFTGISLFASSDNSVMGNTADRNGDRGINLVDAHDNTVARNTTDRNMTGIHLSDNSYRNVVERNTATANDSEGIRLIANATKNTVQDNTITANGTGIWLGLLPGANFNSIQYNTITLSMRGIWLDMGFVANSIQDNTALDSGEVDLTDMNTNCDSNTWFDNDFETDQVAGESDDGPGTGCIR